MFVRFRDYNNPQTVEQVSPENLATDERGTMSVHRVVIQITNEDVSGDIEEKLPWLKSLDGKYLHSGPSAKGAPLGLHAGNFSQHQ
jgi:hypothetical protein